MTSEASSAIQPWRKLYDGGSNNSFNPLLDTIKQPTRKQVILFVHTGKCAGESILKGINETFKKDTKIYEYHVFDANARLLEALEYFRIHKPECFSIVIATRDPLSRWASSYNWDLHNLFLSKNKRLTDDYSTYSDVNLLANGIKTCDAKAMSLGRFGHMGMGISWYLPIEVHSILDPQTTYVMRTEELDSDFNIFARRFCKHFDMQDISTSSPLMLPRTKHNFQDSYSNETFQEFNYSNAEIVESMHRYLENDYIAHENLIKMFC